MDDSKEIKSIDDLVLVHMTDYLPIGGVINTPKTAGVEFNEEFNGVKYNVARKRNTVHFAINHEVAPNQGRDSKRSMCRYAVVVPLKKMEQSTISGGIPVDLYTNGDVTIPEGSYLLCPETELETVKNNVGKNITVIGFEGDFVNGRANELMKQLGYKVEKGGHWSWEDAKDDTAVRRIIQECKWHNSPHSFSKDCAEERLYEDIDRTTKIIQIMMKNEFIPKIPEGPILSQHMTPVGVNTLEVIDDDLYMQEFINKMSEIGIQIPNSVREEVEAIKQGRLSDIKKTKITEEYKRSKYGDTSGNNRYMATVIFRRRVIGEMVLTILKNNLREGKNNGIETVLDKYGDILYDYITEERKQEFLSDPEIQLSNFDLSLLRNQELKNLYIKVKDKKDIPFGNLSENEQPEMISFIEKYGKSFEGYDAQIRYFLNENHEISHAIGRISKKDGNLFSQEDLDAFEEQQLIYSNIENLKIDLKITVLKNDTSLSELITNLESMMKKVTEVLHPKERKGFTIKDIGKRTVPDAMIEEVISAEACEKNIHEGNSYQH